MKSKFIYALASALVLCAGCSDNEIIEKNVPRNEGDEIIFKARTGFESGNPDTKTIYSGETYQDNGKTYERVDWVPNEDKIRIYCEQANNPANGQKWADYNVTANRETESRDAYGVLERHDPKGALQWGAADATHEFYAVYPSPLQNDKVSIEGATVKGTMPTSQTPLSIGNENGTYVAKPDMRFAYLTAHTSVAQGEGGNGISLSFQSIATVIELELTNPSTSATESMSLTDLKITGETNAQLAGDFEANLDNIGKDGYPVCNLVAESEVLNVVNLSLLTGTDKKPVTLARGEKLKVTLFTLPVEDLKGLSLTITTTEGTKTMSLAQAGGKDVVIKAHLKHLLNNINLPAGKIDFSNWLSQIDDKVYLSQLSIPATGNSYTYNYDGNDKQYWQTQTIDIDKQWAMGIRCFEIMATSAGEANKSFADVPIILNNTGTVLGSTVGQAVKAINDKVTANPKEFAMVIIKYQPTGERNATNFLNGFITYFNNLSNVKKVLFKPELTVKDARGGIMFVVRPTSEGEDDNTDLSTADGKDFLVVKGWGSLQDKWKKRGYPVPANPNPTTTSERTMENYMLAEGTSNSSAPSFEALPSKGTVDYTYESNQNFKVWAQEWPRVVEKYVKVYTGKNRYQGTWPFGSDYYLWAQWGESYTEKLDDAKKTFNEAVADKDNTSMVYFNSISGYFIVPTVKETIIPCYVSYNGNYDNKKNGSNWGNIYGDVEHYSTKINDDFYKYVVDQASTAGGAAGITGPMGVVMISRVGADEPSTLMPNVIISNNFKFPLKKAEGTTTTNATYSNGGNAIQ